MQVTTDEEGSAIHDANPPKVTPETVDDSDNDDLDVETAIARIDRISLDSPSSVGISLATAKISSSDIHSKGVSYASHDRAAFSSSGSDDPSDDGSSSDSDGEDCMPNDGLELIGNSDEEDEDGLECHGENDHDHNL